MGRLSWTTFKRTYTWALLPIPYGMKLWPKGRMYKWDRPYYIAFALGFKCNNAIWKPIFFVEAKYPKNPWFNFIDNYLVKWQTFWCIWECNNCASMKCYMHPNLFIFSYCFEVTTLHDVERFFYIYLMLFNVSIYGSNWYLFPFYYLLRKTN